MKHTIEVTCDIRLVFSAEVGDPKAKRLVADYWDREERWADDAQCCLQRWAEDTAQEHGADAITQTLQAHVKKLELVSADDDSSETLEFKLTECSVEAEADAEEV